MICSQCKQFARQTIGHNGTLRNVPLRQIFSRCVGSVRARLISKIHQHISKLIILRINSKIQPYVLMFIKINQNDSLLAHYQIPNQNSLLRNSRLTKHHYFANWTTRKKLPGTRSIASHVSLLMQQSCFRSYNQRTAVGVKNAQIN